MPRVVDLNADLGEEVTDDEALLGLVTSANVACGYHAGSPAIMRSVCALAAGLGVSVGAQVSYADRENFGRVSLDVQADVLREQVADQVGLLSAIADSEGVSVRYLKPHGALYHRVRDDVAQAAAVLAGSGGLPVLGMSGALLTLAVEAGREVILEGFPDRAYDGDRLRPRDRLGPVALPPRRHTGGRRARPGCESSARGCRMEPGGAVRTRPVGERAVLAEVDSPEESAALAAWLADAGLEADDVVPAART